MMVVLKNTKEYQKIVNWRRETADGWSSEKVKC